MQSIVAFPGFNEDKFPLVLIQEWECVVIFNVKAKTYRKVADIDVQGEYESAFNQRMGFIGKEKE